MTDIEQKALALVNEVRAESRGSCADRQHLRHADMEELEAALCRAIEQHEKFKWEVSYAALSALKVVMEMAEHDCEVMVRPILERFIIAKPDPLVEVLADMGLKSKGGDDWASEFRNTLAQRGGKIVWGEG